MRILYANAYYYPNQPGGAEVMMQAMAEGMAARGHEVAVLTTAAESTQDEVNGIPVHRVGLRNIFWKLPKEAKPSWQKLIWHGVDRDNPFMRSPIREVLQKVRPDVLVSNNLPGMSIGLWREAKALGIPIVHVLHDYYLICPSVTMHKGGHNCERVCGSCSVFRGPHAEASNMVDAVIGVSKAILDTHLRYGVFGKTPIKRVIYNARDLPRPGLRAAKSAEQAGQLVFGFIGAVSEVKGVEPLIHAFMAARQQHPGITLLVAGAGEEGFVNRMKAIAPSDVVRFVGRVDAMKFFSEIDVCIAPSQWNDPFPGVVYEAISQGVPVIGAARGGIPEVIHNGRNGWLFDPDQDGSLEAIIRDTASAKLSLMNAVSDCVDSVSHLTSRERMMREHEACMAEARQHGG